MSFMENFEKELNGMRASEGKSAVKVSSGSKSSSKSTTKKKKKNGFMDNFYEELSSIADDDIGPVYDRARNRMTVKGDAEEDDGKLDFFQKGLFEDGYQAGDITKTILGTAGDAALGVVKGVGSLVEGVADLGQYGVAGVADLLGKEDVAEEWKKSAKWNLVDSVTKDATDYLDQYSVLGRTSEAILQGVGQVGGIVATGGLGAAAGLGTAGTTALTTGVMGLSSMGSGMGEAYQGGATDEEAVTYGLISGAADALTEMMFGGMGKAVNAVGLSKGLSSADDMLAKAVSKKFSNQIAKNFAEFGVKASAEGLEEVVAGVAQAMGKKFTYMSEKDMKDILEDENLLEQFIVGSATSGMIQSGIIPGTKKGSLIEANKNESDFLTGTTKNEQAVIRKEVENRVAAEEQSGKKLTEKEKDAIEEQVVRDLEKGYISTDTIEEVLGGSTYDIYKGTVDSEDAILREYEELGQKTNATLKDQARYTELTQKVKDIREKSQRDALKTQLGEEVFNLVKGNRLAESYNERARRGQAFQADLTKYDAKQQAVIQKAIDSGILNNTNRTHEFVDLVSKISADKGVLFDFTNNQKLKDSGFAVEGKQVNGYVTKDGITLNIDSKKALETTVGHEITHVLEGTEVYDALKQTIFDYAKAKGEYQGRYDSLAELYKDVKDADIEGELTADLVGDYLFSDTDFINNLSTKNRNVFQKIYDEIKYLCKVVTAGSKEARELEKVRRAFEKAYREGGKSTADVKSEDFYDSTTKYSLRVTDKETLDFLDKQETVTTYKTMQLVDGKLYPPMAARVEGKFEDYSELGSWEQATERPDLIKNGKFKLDKGKGQGSIEAAYNPYMHSSNLVLNDQFSGAYKRDNLVTVECEVPVSELTSGYHAEYAKDSVGWHPWHTGTVAGQLRKAKGTERQVFLSRWIKPVRIVPDSEVAAMYKELLDGTGVEVPDNVVTPSLLNELKNAGVKVKESGRVKYSLSDSDGRQFTAEQQEYFKDSKVRDENGNLKAVYHGTASGEFTIFDKAKGSVEGDFGSGFYFTDNEADVSEHYEGGGPDFENKVARRAEQIEAEEDIDYEEAEERAREELFKGGHKFEVYLNIENPAIVGRTYLFDSEFGDRYNEEDFEDYDEYIAETEQAVADAVEEIIWEVENNVDVYSTDGLADVIYEAYYEGGIGIEELKDRINQLYLEDNDGNFVGNEVVRQIIESLGYDGIIDPTVSGKWNMDIEDGTTHYIVFKPNQIKAVTNQNPTDNPDIRYSLTEQEAQETNDKLGNVGMQYDSNSGTVSYSLSSLEDAFDYNKGEAEYHASREEYANALAKATGKTAEEANRYLDSMFLVHDMIAADRNRLDYESAPNKSAWVSNAEYGGSIDFSTLCAKRRLFTGTFDAIQNALPDTVLNDTDFLNIRNLLLESGQESPCSMCYVEGSRAKHGVYVSKFLKEYLKTDPEWKPQIADFASTTRLEQTRIQHPEAYEAYRKAMNKLSQRKPKEASVRTDYKGEILRDFKDTSTVAEKNKNGGVRFNSFSDFEIIHAIDCMQVLTDMSRVGLNGQAYTKVKEFAEAFGNTGLKINLSLVAKDVDTNGKLVMDETNGMNYAEAMDIRKRYSDNVGTVIVVFNDRQLMAALADNTIDYVLPFHRSQWKKSQYDLMGLPNTTRDYTNIQNDRYKNPKTGKPKKAPNGNIMPNEYWDFTLSGRENAQKYLDYINENDYIPKFDFLLDRVDGNWVLPEGPVGDGYFKLLIDFKMYNNDGVGSPQMPVLPEFNMPYIQEMLDNYVGGHKAFPVAHDVVEKFVQGKKKGEFSLSDMDEAPVRPNYRATMGEDIALEDIAPVAENSTVQQETQLTEGNSTLSETETVDEAPLPDSGEEVKQTRKQYHQSIIDRIRGTFKTKGFDFDNVLKNAKNLSTWSTVDNTPQRVMEKALGYKAGGVLADITVNKVAQNESEGIKWVNRNVATLKQISRQYHIKPGSKESAAAQMYAEGFYVNKNNEIVRYGDPELIQDFKNPEVRRNIKGLARDPRIRKIYDDTLASINESRTRNLYPEIPRLDNYFLHFRAMNDTFSTLGLPFNPNDIKAKDLPTDLNGVTADLKPGQPYFASAMHREGKRTSFDLLGGVERYLNSAKNQIYHIDDIQTLRALRNHIAETYGQATGLEDIDSLSDAEAEERIKQVYGAHLSTFAKFLNEEANVLAGKTALIDRGLEGIIGRRGITFLNTLNQQVGSNMVGYNVSSSLTNFLPVAQAFAKTNKFDFVKAFAQTAANKVSGGRLDSFTEDSPVVIRRKGQDRFYQTLWQKMQNPGYALMGMVDDISTELIARTKYNEFVRKGMDSQKAHFETDKWVSRLMGDRSLGQMPQLYNSKMLGLITKFQLEVRNQLDAQFYDTIQETKVSNEHIRNGLARNARTAAQVASTFAQLAVVQHLFGMAFESVAGYNPAFDIIEVLMTAFGYDDEEDSEDTALDNFAQGLLALAEDMPYASTFTGGRVPITEAIPDVNAILRGEDEYGNEIGIPQALVENAKEIAPYYLLPGGFGQAKKTVAGLKMFSDEHPIAGSYTDAGNLRFPVEDTLKNRIHAGIFGQYANENARKYFDQEQRTLNPDQTAIFAELDMPIEDYWEYRDNLYAFYDAKDQLEEAAEADGATDEDILKSRYAKSVYSDINKLYSRQKEIAGGNSLLKQEQLRDIQSQMEKMLSESKSAVDNISVSGAYAEVGDRRYNYDAEEDTWYEIKPKNADGSDNYYYQQEQEITKKFGISYSEYWNNRDEYSFAYSHPKEYALAKAIGGYDAYADHYDALENWKSDSYIASDKDKYGDSISGSRKKKVQAYIDGLDISDIDKILLFKSVYTSYDDYNSEIIDYLNSRKDLSYEEKEFILVKLGAKVDSEGYIEW